MGLKIGFQPTDQEREGTFPSRLGVFLGCATLVSLLALIPAAFLFGNDPRDWPFQSALFSMIGLAAAFFATLAFNFGRMQAKMRKNAKSIPDDGPLPKDNPPPDKSGG